VLGDFVDHLTASGVLRFTRESRAATVWFRLPLLSGQAQGSLSISAWWKPLEESLARIRVKEMYLLMLDM
jgi:hypothetical protein